MCPKLFILKEFYFLILESNLGLHRKYSSKLLNTKIKESKINESQKTKECFTIIKKYIYEQFTFYT